MDIKRNANKASGKKPKALLTIIKHLKMERNNFNENLNFKEGKYYVFVNICVLEKSLDKKLVVFWTNPCSSCY